MITNVLANLIWNRNNEIKASIYNLSFNDSNVKLYLKVAFAKSNSDLYKNAVLMVKGRGTKTKHKFEITFKESLNFTRLAEVSIPTEIFLDDQIKTWDLYILIKSKEKVQAVRIEDFITNLSEINDYAINKSIKLKPYSTVNGNFSFKTSHNTISAELLNIEVIDQELLNIKGRITGLYFENEEITLIFYDSKDASEYRVKINPIDTNDEIIFEKNINLNNFNINESAYKLYIEIDGSNLYKKVPFIFSDNVQTENKKLLINVNNNRYKLDFITNTKKKNISIYFSKQDYLVEINEVLVYEDDFSIKGFICCESEKPLNGNFKVIMRRREGFGEVTDELTVQNNSFTFTLPIRNLIYNNMLFNGIWDLYLLINNDEFRLVSHLDGIPNKRSIINFPQRSFANKENEIKAVKLYYTLYNGLSILVRNYISGARIKYVNFNGSHVAINGLMNIQPPNDNIPEVLTGTVEAKFPYGEKVELPFTLSLSKTKGLQFNYNMQIELEDKIKNKLNKYISYDLLRCVIDFPVGKGTLYLNILPTMIVNKSEKFIKAHPRLSKIINSLKLKSYYVMNKILPINQKTVIFQATTGMNYSCNPRAIYEEMLERNLNIKAVWVVNRLHSNIEGNPIIVKPNTLKYYYYMATGKYFINNGNFPNFYEKRKGTVHIQTWHGTPLKKLGFDIDPSSPSYKENTSEQLMRRNSRWDYLVAPNEYTGEILRRAYLFKKKMLNVGYPRNDIFYKTEHYKSEIVKRTKEYLNIPLNKKVILYAPTWRDNEFHEGQANEPYNFKFRLEKFAQKFGDEYVLLVRLHPREAVRCQIKDLDNLIYNVSNYDEIKHLYLMSDILITDYSSVMFDFANTKKPIVFFAHDIEKYSSALRGFYFDLRKEAPGPIVKTESELFNAIENIEEMIRLYKEKYNSFYQKFCSWEDGHASERVINEIFSDLDRRR